MPRTENKENKIQKKKEILSATARLYKRLNYVDITFSDIAREADFTRSNLYKYFDSREEVFIELFMKDFDRWRNNISKVLDTVEECSINMFSSIWSETTLKQKRFCRLLVILHSNLEKKISTKYQEELKNMFSRQFALLAEKILSIFPMLTEEKVMDFLKYQHALTIGLVSLGQVRNLGTRDLDFELDRLLNNAVEHLFTGVIVSY